MWAHGRSVVAKPLHEVGVVGDPHRRRAGPIVSAVVHAKRRPVSVVTTRLIVGPAPVAGAIVAVGLGPGPRAEPVKA